MKPKNAPRMESSLSRFSNFFFILIGLFLSLSSLAILVLSLIRIVLCNPEDCDLLNEVLNLVSYLIISAAIFDVGRYLLEEEVFKDRELRSPSEARRSLTKFMVIIVIAVTLESLIAVIKASRAGDSELVYPAILFFVAILLLVGLGLYQRLSVLAEKQVD